MNYSQIRTYFKNQIQAVDSDFREWTDGFNFENVPSSIFDKAYHISTPTTNSSDEQQSFTDLIEVDLGASFKGGRNVQDKIFQSLDLMRDVRNKIVNIKDLNDYNDTINSDQHLQKISPVTIGVSPLNTNDDRFTIALSFTVITAYSFCA